MQQVSCVRELAANDVVKMYCSQTSGGNLTMKANPYAPRLAATWLRPRWSVVMPVDMMGGVSG
jgi:hypothetical protein